MTIDGIYIGLDAGTLATMKTEAIALLHAIRTAHQSIGNIGGRSYSRAQMQDAMKDLAEINYAQRVAGGSIISKTFGDVSG